MMRGSHPCVRVMGVICCSLGMFDMHFKMVNWVPYAKAKHRHESHHTQRYMDAICDLYLKEAQAM